MARVKKPKFQTPTGIHDILPEDYVYFQKVYKIAEDIAKFYGFKGIEVPVIECADLFSRGIGIDTDIIEKEMYILKTKGGDVLALRPEFTAGIVRAYNQHGLFSLPQPLKLFSKGALFRYEHPQSGRFRQFHQFNLEVFGEKKSVVDAQIIQIFFNILKELGLKNLVVELNSIGDSQCRPYYKKILIKYLKSKESSLCPDCRRRLKKNPLRVLDCKEEKCQKIVSQAPQIIDHLCDECHNHFKEVLEFLDELEIPYNLNPYLVRGLDYYTKTVFEIYEYEDNNEEKEKSNSLVGGGRFDRLVKLLGGKDIPACGGATGIERVVNLVKTKAKFSQPMLPKVFLAQLGSLAKRKSLQIFEEFRKAKIPIGEAFSKDSLKAQLRIANRLGADYILILGQREVIEGEIIIKKMDTGKQETVKLDKLIEEMKKKIKNK